MGPHWPQDGPQVFPTVIWRHNRKFDFLPKSMTAEYSKIRIWGMVIFYGFDPFFGPNGTPLTSRWTLGGPHRDLAPLPLIRFFAQMDDRGVVKNSNFGAW